MAKITRRTIVLCATFTLLFIIGALVSVGFLLLGDESNAQSAFSSHDASATSIANVDGFEMIKSTKCDALAPCSDKAGCGINASSSAKNTLAACSDRCLTSSACRAFEYAPKKDAFCVLYERTVKSVSSGGAEAACYVRTASNINVHSSSDFAIRAKQPEDQEVDLALQCVKKATSFDRPDVAKLANMEASIIKQARAAREVELHQSDFDTGTFMITRPGYYKLQENIKIKFPEDPLNTTSPFQHDWTMGISIVADQNVVIDLNGKTMKMSKDNHHRMRFFNMIQLNDKVFPRGVVGFTGDLVSAARIVVFSSSQTPGVLKRITHFGIAGMGNTDVVIRNVRIENFEVAGISLADAHNVFIKDVDIDNTNLRVEWKPYFSVMSQLRRRLHQLVSSKKESTEEGQRWQSKLDFVDDKLQNAGWLKSASRSQTPGNTFGLQLKAMANPKDAGGKMVHIKDVTVKHIHSGPSEIVAIRHRGRPIRDTDLNVFDWDDVFDSTGKIKKCAEGDDRCKNKKKINEIRMDATLALEGHTGPMQQGVRALRREMDQILNGDHVTTNLKPTSGADSRNHIPKGAFGIRLVGLEDAVLENVLVADVRSYENAGLSTGALQNHHESPILWRGEQNAQKVFKGNIAHGIFGQRSRNIMLEKAVVRDIESTSGSAIGVGFGDKSRYIIFKDVSASLKPRKSKAPSTKIPNIVPAVIPFYAEEGYVDCFRFVDIVDSQHGPDEPRAFVAPVVDCASTEAANSDLCEAIDTPQTTCPVTLASTSTCSEVKPTQTLCDFHSLQGTGQAKCRNLRVQVCDFTNANTAAACCANDLGLWQCPSDLPAMCKATNGVHHCAPNAERCTTFGGIATGKECPISAQYGGGSFTPNCPLTLDRNIPVDASDMYLTCRNGAVCPVFVDVAGVGSGWDCCNDTPSTPLKGGRLKCPPSFPFMCADRADMCGGDHCCSLSARMCERDFGGLLSDTDTLNTNDCPTPVSPTQCSVDSDCPHNGQTCDGSKCVGYAHCANPSGESEKNTTTVCVNRETCHHDANNGDTCCTTADVNSQVFQCPRSAKYLCHNRSCRGDFCCMKSVRDCDQHGGLRDPDTDKCPEALPPPPTCASFESCHSSQYIANPSFVCTSGRCRQSDCCKSKPTCASVNVKCGPNATRTDSLICSNLEDTQNCTTQVCCAPHQKCFSHTCTLEYYLVPPERREFVCNGLDSCDDNTCCEPTCRSVFADDKSCHAVAPGTLVNPKENAAICAANIAAENETGNTGCLAAQCCMDTCDVVNCSTFGIPGSFLTNPNAPRDCGITGSCNVDTCCRPTCATHTCSSEAGEAGIPRARTTRQCAGSQCTDEECCTPVCGHYFRPFSGNVCTRGGYVLLRNEKLLCSENSLEVCAKDCCTRGSFKSITLPDGDRSLSSTSIVSLTLFSLAGVLALCACVVASWAVMHEKRKRGAGKKCEEDIAVGTKRQSSNAGYHRAPSSSPRNASPNSASSLHAAFDDSASARPLRQTGHIAKKDGKKHKGQGKGEQKGRGKGQGKGAHLPFVSGVSSSKRTYALD